VCVFNGDLNNILNQIYERDKKKIPCSFFFFSITINLILSVCILHYNILTEESDTPYSPYSSYFIPRHRLILLPDMPKLSQKDVDAWLHAAWKDGFDKGVDGRDELPDFDTIKPARNSPDKDKLSPEEASLLPFNPDKCKARMYQAGYGVQCTRSHKEGCGDFCMTHHKKIPDDTNLNLRFGIYGQERPNHWLDKSGDQAEKISWTDQRSTKSNKQPKKRVLAKEMRDKLTEIGVSIEGLKGKELTARYNEEIALHQEQSAQEQPESHDEALTEETLNEAPAETPSDETTEEAPAETTEETPAETTEETPAEEAPAEEAPAEETPAEETSVTPVEEQPETPIDETSETLGDTENDNISQAIDSVIDETSDEISDDGTGTGITSLESKTKSVSEYKDLFKSLGISTDGLKGKRAYKERYEEFLSEKKEETDDMSDEDELDKDTRDFAEIDFEGVDYLEDENSGEIFSLNHQLVGSWNEDCDDFIWTDESARISHESRKD
jgi:hypothetical protein